LINEIAGTVRQSYCATGKNEYYDRGKERQHNTERNIINNPMLLPDVDTFEAQFSMTSSNGAG
jgi:hypothetical protein